MEIFAPSLTIEDYKVLPETGPRYQLIDGSLFMSPAPTRFHQHISRNLEFIILTWIRAGGGGEIYDAPFDVYLDSVNVFQPDLVYVAPDNLGILTEAGVEGAPDLIIEILSPSTRKLDLGPKKKTFAQYGVKELWAIDPDTRTLQKFDLTGDCEVPVLFCAENDTLQSSILPDLVIDLQSVFN